MSRPVCVLGMHRSGTTIVAAMVQRLGVDFGPAASMMPAHVEDNPRGYSEQLGIVRVNDRILRARGGTWWQPPPDAPGWEQSRRFGLIRRRARKTAEELYGAQRWGFKDPRFSLTLPLWRGIVGELDCVVCVRDPAEVAASLLRRFRETLPGHPAAALDSNAWGEVWRSYMEGALAAASGGRRLLVSHAGLVRDGGAEAERLGEFLGVPLSAEARRDVAGMVEPGLWRNRDDQLTVPAEARSLYARLTGGIQG